MRKVTVELTVPDLRWLIFFASGFINEPTMVRILGVLKDAEEADARASQESAIVPAVAEQDK